jgi:hypothetical protein
MAEELTDKDFGEKTGTQLTGTSTIFLFEDVGALSVTLAASYDTYRTIRKDPTIALARTLVAAPVLIGNWMVEADKDTPTERKDLITECIIPMRDHVMETALLFAHVDFGWQAYEKVFAYKDGRVILAKLKPLLVDITEIMVSAAHGTFAGLRQSRDELTLSLAKSLLISFRVEGTNWYGEGLLEGVRMTCNKWNDADLSASRYDRKIAGSRLVIKYPKGTSPLGGVDTLNENIAVAMGKSLEASGIVVCPNILEEDGEESGFVLKILEDKGGRQAEFIDRLKYLDSLKARALLLPERAALEGQYGTKAEAAEHADIAITSMELVDRRITRHINWHVVDQLLALNFGESARGSVWLTPTPLVDEALGFLRELYVKVLESPTGFLEEYGSIDTKQLKEGLGIPIIEEDKREGEEDDLLEITPTPGEPPGPDLEGSRHLGYLTRKILQGSDGRGA